MAESEFQEGNHDDRRKSRENLKEDLEELLEEMEKLTVHLTWIVYDCTVIRTNPDLTNDLQHLGDAFLRCKEQIKKEQQDVPME
ncbi:SYCE3 protein, partial [Daphoenositta chrysoptera]|nr:SYCE3 protein [Daphoenositta chrysoptera]